MSKAKGKDAVVNQKHMPRKNGSCKKSESGKHEPIKVARREVVQIVDHRKDYFAYGGQNGWMIREYVYCEPCGKTAAGHSNEITDLNTAVWHLGQDETPTIKNRLNTVNDRMKDPQE